MTRFGTSIYWTLSGSEGAYSPPLHRDLGLVVLVVAVTFGAYGQAVRFSRSCPTQTHPILHLRLPERNVHDHLASRPCHFTITAFHPTSTSREAELPRSSTHS
jgi:hypothetical protein